MWDILFPNLIPKKKPLSETNELDLILDSFSPNDERDEINEKRKDWEYDVG
jgi:hypothetical protein